MKLANLIFATVAGLLFVSAIAQVYVVHLNRTSFTQLQQMQAQRDEMNLEWGRLQIEQAAWSTHSRIEQVASQQLQMKMPSPSTVVIVRR